MSHERVDIAIIGAGAAGLIAAIAAARLPVGQAGAQQHGSKILLLDTREKIGAKILISGGTRCNVTNVQVTPRDYEGGPKHFVKHVLEAFTPAETLEFFKEIGVEVVLEPSGKYFPVTHSGKTVLDALLKETDQLGISLKTGMRITGIKKSGEVFYLKGCPGGRPESSAEWMSKRVLLATGGLSYPETGSDGTGFDLSKKLGHSIIRTVPALTPLTTDNADWKSLTGIAVNVRLSFYKKERKEAEREGALLFTHFGFSGPAALDISRFVASASNEDRPEIMANFLPGETEESLKKRFEKGCATNPGKQIRNFLVDEYGFASRFTEVFFKKTNIDQNLTLKKCSKAVRGRLIHLLLNCPLDVTGVVGYKKAEVTAGGVNLNEVKASTMESKIVPGLYFAGEILDLDGRIGGFNFQLAWSTGTIAGRSAARSLNGL